MQAYMRIWYYLVAALARSLIGQASLRRHERPAPPAKQAIEDVLEHYARQRDLLPLKKHHWVALVHRGFGKHFGVQPAPAGVELLGDACHFAVGK